MTMKNTLTIDVEDYFHVAALGKSIDLTDWDRIEPRVVDNMNRLLDMFDEHGVKATHFVLGWVAERFPELIKEIDRRGHEVASHGYSHQLVYNQSPEVFFQETKDSKSLIENIIGKPIFGYRAASYSITKKSLWALDTLAELGFIYDSSIFPVVHDRYGIKDSPIYPHVLETPGKKKLVEYPLSTYTFLGQAIPVAGGGYFRLYPYWLSRFFYRSINKSNMPFVFYLHPWEVDPGQPRVKASFISEFRHYNNLEKCQGRLASLLSDFEFVTMKEKLDSLGLFNESNSTLVSY